MYTRTTPAAMSDVGLHVAQKLIIAKCVTYYNINKSGIIQFYFKK